jgi:hypothetical protein
MTREERAKRPMVRSGPNGAGVVMQHVQAGAGREWCKRGSKPG